jgi:hypothetical protein
MDGWSSKTSEKAGQIEAPVLPSDIEMAAPAATPFSPEQVPYVPAQARTTKPVPLAVKEEVVTVKKAKKRKADTTIPAVPEMTASPSDEPSPAKRAKATANTKGKKKAVKAEDIPEFDYAQEPNQLDTFAPESSAKIKKTKKSKKRKSYSDLHSMICSLITCIPQLLSTPQHSESLLRIRQSWRPGTNQGTSSDSTTI